MNCAKVWFYHHTHFPIGNIMNVRGSHGWVVQSPVWNFSWMYRSRQVMTMWKYTKKLLFSIQFFAAELDIDIILYIFLLLKYILKVYWIILHYKDFQNIKNVHEILCILKMFKSSNTMYKLSWHLLCITTYNCANATCHTQ